MRVLNKQCAPQTWSSVIRQRSPHLATSAPAAHTMHAPNTRHSEERARLQGRVRAEALCEPRVCTSTAVRSSSTVGWSCAAHSGRAFATSSHSPAASKWWTCSTAVTQRNAFSEKSAPAVSQKSALWMHREKSAHMQRECVHGVRAVGVDGKRRVGGAQSTSSVERRGVVDCREHEVRHRTLTAWAERHRKGHAERVRC
jgi:hypothetical protein